MNDEQAPAPRAGASRLRVALIALVALGAALAIAVVVLSSSGSSDGGGRPTAAVEPADGACLDAWNADRAQVELGGHEARDHQVNRAWVLILGFDGKPPASRAQGDCVVVFPTPKFGDGADDPRHVAQIRNGDAGWQPLRQLPAVTPARVAGLRAQARERANAALDEDGSLAPLSSS